MNRIAAIAGALVCVVLAVEVVRPGLWTGLAAALRRVLAKRG
ncbi:hypothetical protein WDZ92_43040 [Nostoc sp. NIES-2111]